jgi:hypothetical protein
MLRQAVAGSGSREPRLRRHVDEIGAVGTLLRDPDRRLAMAHVGPELQRSNLDADAMVRWVEPLFEELFPSTERSRERRTHPERFAAA